MPQVVAESEQGFVSDSPNYPNYSLGTFAHLSPNCPTNYSLGTFAHLSPNCANYSLGTLAHLSVSNSPNYSLTLPYLFLEVAPQFTLVEVPPPPYRSLQEIWKGLFHNGHQRYVLALRTELPGHLERYHPTETKAPQEVRPFGLDLAHFADVEGRRILDT